MRSLDSDPLSDDVSTDDVVEHVRNVGVCVRVCVFVYVYVYSCVCVRIRKFVCFL
jgi:hypothetical protein